MIVGGLATDVKIAGRWGIVSGHETNSFLNQRESGHGFANKRQDRHAYPQQRKTLGLHPGDDRRHKGNYV